MPVVTAASPGIEAGNLRKRIVLLQQVAAECTISGGLSTKGRTLLFEAYRAHLEAQLEWLTDELAVNEAQLELALFPPATS